MTTSDKWNTNKQSVTIKYSEEVASKLQIDQTTSYPVVGPKEYLKLEKRRLSLACALQFGVSAMAVGGLLLNPSSAVQAAVAGILASGTAISSRLLWPTRHRTGRDR